MRAARALEDSVYVRAVESRGSLREDASLEECLLYAARHNPGLEAAFYRWKAATEQVPRSRSLSDPRLTYAYFLREVETRVGPQRQRLSISQTFPWFGKLAARGDAALEAARAAEQRYEGIRLRLFHAVTRMYAEHYYLARAIELTRENLELMMHWEEVARAKFRAGTGTHAEVIKAQVEIGSLSDRLRTLTDRRGAVLAELNALLQRPVDAPLTAADSLRDEAVGASDSALTALLPEESPELRALESEIERRRHELRLSSKEFYPDFNLGAGYVMTGEAVNREQPDSGKDPLTVQISINVPIWRGKYAAGTRAAEARLRAARQDRQDRLKRLEAAVKRVAYELRDAGRKVRLYQDTLIPKGNQALQATSTAFQAGSLDFLNVIDAQRVLLEFRLAYERALADQTSRLAELEMLVGRDLPRTSGVER
ncbi:MAG: TolC family protein [Candidatus Krumholzibacteriia bacterium]